MDMKLPVSKIANAMKKYRYAILVLALGIVLMLIPAHSSQTQIQDTTPSATDGAGNWDITGELTRILSQIQGVGNVKVMLTVATGEQTIYQVDENTSIQDTGSNIQKETVIITGSDRQEQPVISFVKPPTYLGAIIVCQGADQPAVKLAILDAVSKITGLGSDKISVVKMK